MLLFTPPVHANALLEQGRAAIEARDYDAAAVVLERAHRAEPRNAAVAYAYATAEITRGNAARALELSEIAVRREGTNPDHHFLLGNLLAMNIDSMGALGKLRAAGRMRSAWEKAVDLNPNHVEARFALASFYAQAPGVVGGGRDKAEMQIREIARVDTVMGHRARAVLLSSDRDYDEALR
ncbi:MAG: tetratricopeptide repeat protein, partial [Fimbriimonadales bacterium]